MASEKTPSHDAPSSKFIDIENQSQKPQNGSSLSGNAWQQRQYDLGNTLPGRPSSSQLPSPTTPTTIKTINFHHTAGPISRKERVARKIHSVFAIIFFFTAVHPFSPISWLLPFGGYGAEIADWLVADLLLACACYFHYRIATLDEDLVVDFPTFGGLLPGKTAIRNGHVVTDAGPVPSWIYRPEWYWRIWIVEWGVLGMAQVWRGEYEIVRRIVAVVAVVAWWIVGVLAPFFVFCGMLCCVLMRCVAL